MLNIEDVPLKSINMSISEATFSSKRLSSELSFSEDYVEAVYYRNGYAAGKPFVWESVPGTPKNKSSESKPPPLAPPPSFHSMSVVKNNLHDDVKKKILLQKSPSRRRCKSSSRSFDSRDDHDFEAPVSCYYVYFCCWA